MSSLARALLDARPHDGQARSRRSCSVSKVMLGVVCALILLLIGNRMVRGGFVDYKRRVRWIVAVMLLCVLIELFRPAAVHELAAHRRAGGGDGSREFGLRRSASACCTGCRARSTCSKACWALCSSGVCRDTSHPGRSWRVGQSAAGGRRAADKSRTLGCGSPARSFPLICL